MQGDVDALIIGRDVIKTIQKMFTIAEHEPVYSRCNFTFPEGNVGILIVKGNGVTDLVEFFIATICEVIKTDVPGGPPN